MTFCYLLLFTMLLVMAWWFTHCRLVARQLSHLSMLSDPLILVDRRGRIRWHNGAAAKIFPRPEQLSSGAEVDGLLETPETDSICHWLRAHAGSQHTDARIFSCLDASGEGCFYRLHLLAYYPRASALLMFRPLDASAQGSRVPQHTRMLEHVPLGILICRLDAMVHANPAALQMLGVAHEHMLKHTTFAQHIRQGFRQDFQHALQQLRNGHTPAPLEVEIQRADGEPLWVELSLSRIRWEGESMVQVLLHDIHRRKQDEARLTWLSCYDALTELPNRRLFVDRLHQAIALAQREKKTLALLYFDLDRFKYVNDSLGHAVGDEVLRMAASRLRLLLRESDSPARLGGDEFAALLPHADIHAARTVASKLLFSLRQPYRIEARELTLGASIGIALYPDDSDNPDTLLRRADAAMYHAKKQRAGIHFFAREMEERNRRSMLLEQELAREGMQYEFHVHYQGQYALNDDGSTPLIGLEALLRWEHPRLGAISPNEFIPLAEETGQIGQIVNWVVEQCAAQAVIWESQGIRPDKIAMNLSSTQLMEAGVAAEIIGRIVAAGAQPHWFELEITETAMMRDPETAICIMRELVESGLSIAMDDYGTGYSSLAYIKQLPARKIKIDRSFISLLPEDDDDAAIVRSTIAMGHALGKKLLAEGVETSEQLDFLRREGCDSVQGFLFQQALDAEQTSCHLQQQRATAKSPA